MKKKTLLITLCVIAVVLLIVIATSFDLQKAHKESVELKHWITTHPHPILVDVQYDGVTSNGARIRKYKLTDKEGEQYVTELTLDYLPSIIISTEQIYGR